MPDDATQEDGEQKWCEFIMVSISHLQKANLESIQNISKYTAMGEADVAEADKNLDNFQM